MNKPLSQTSLVGAPNYRNSKINIHGVAQCSFAGAASVLSFIRSSSTNPIYWFSAREEPLVYINSFPYVLRDTSSPLQNIKRFLGINSLRLEQMEDRLKLDVINEAARYKGLLLVHDEHDSNIIPTWTCVLDVQTPRQIFDKLNELGYNVNYFRIPISPEQAPDDLYLDEYMAVINKTNPNDPLVFNCGMGIGRTTFAMVSAMIIRRKIMLRDDLPDPFPDRANSYASLDILGNDDYDNNRTMLRLVFILENGLKNKFERSVIGWALERGPLIEDLKSAVLGNYQIILQLTSVLSNGLKSKKLLDKIVNQCEDLVNLREVILLHRLKYSTTGNITHLQSASACLERYFFLIAFSSYVNEWETVHQTGGKSEFKIISFRSWLSNRTEIWRMLERFRKQGHKLVLFRPVEDLSVFSENQGEKDAQIINGHVQIAPEIENFIVKSRHGTVLSARTILKVDFWGDVQNASFKINGASNFRKIPGFPVYGVAQPTMNGIRNSLQFLGQEHSSKILWINLREEPLIYINGTPYVLRDNYLTLRNLNSYSGITSQRLEMIESRLKEDVLAELAIHENKIMIHAEEKSKTHAVWAECNADSSVMTTSEIMNSLKLDSATTLCYFRVPVTAERAPDETDFDLILNIISRRNEINTAVIVNCQVGVGRSTTGTVIAALVLNWLSGNLMLEEDAIPTKSSSIIPRMNYTIINTLLRVVKNGLEAKKTVDDAIDRCSAVLNIRESIELCRLEAELEPKEDMKASLDSFDSNSPIRQGLLHLKRYFMIIAFQCYLDVTSADSLGVDIMTFKEWMQSHSEFNLMIQEMEQGAINSLVPVEKMSPGDGIALTTEVLDVVNRRNGGVLARQTILKYDMFPGAQKMSLEERIDGAPNYRGLLISTIRSLNTPRSSRKECDGPRIYGIGMPTMEAIRSVMIKTGIEKSHDRKLLWTSLREEPVVYVNGRPYVLRLFANPMKNLEATGIIRERVEAMEERMKLDIINELRYYDGRVLLHDEEGDISNFTIIPIWETVSEDDVMTPLDVYKVIQKEGYNIDYLRIPITDEQAPIPGVFDDLVDRVSGISNHVDVLFNCQMGRGRTTTGLVSVCLIEMIMGNATVFNGFDELSIERIGTPDSLNQFQYLKGEYRIILQLIAVLRHGKFSKKLTDLCIDECGHVQNLRTTIYDYKLKIENGNNSNMLNVGINFLVRYFYLITFADYLLEQTVNLNRRGRIEGNNVKPKIRFSDWLDQRREITNILKKMKQEIE